MFGMLQMENVYRWINLLRKVINTLIPNNNNNNFYKNVKIIKKNMKFFKKNLKHFYNKNNPRLPKYNNYVDMLMNQLSYTYQNMCKTCI
jgi:hypothetical protein